VAARCTGRLPRDPHASGEVMMGRFAPARGRRRGRIRLAAAGSLVVALAALPAAPAAAQSAGARTTRVDSAVGATLSPGDVVRLRIWREPDLSGDYVVDETGQVVFPLVGRLRVVDESAPSLRARLTGSYARFLQSPSVEVIPLRRVTVLGAVRTPGVYAVDLTTTVADALALAGGVGPDGNPDRVELLRGGRRVATFARSALFADLPLRTGDQLQVRERAWITRNAALVASIASGVVTLAIVLATR
jgi:polysaccharide export outer membrane protein